MTLRRIMATCGVAAATLAATAAPSQAVVGGNDASPGEYPAVALVSYGVFQCTGTLIAPNFVLTAGHCSSIDAGVIGTPITWPAALIDVRIGGHRYGEGERVPVARVHAHANYLATSGYDISLLELSRNSTNGPVQVAGTGEGALWKPGTLETIVGWGVTEEGGAESPDVLQEAQVPITTDAYCGDAYSNFDVETMVCAGFPEGGVDTCQGDSGGPMFGKTSGGTLRVVGSTSFGDGCARAGSPGVYARVADTTLREWIRQRVPAGVSDGTTAATTSKSTTGKKPRRKKARRARR